MTSVCSHVSLLLSACPPFSGTQHPCAASCLSLPWMLLRDRALTFVQHAIHCCPDAEGGMVLAAFNTRNMYWLVHSHSSAEMPCGVVSMSMGRQSKAVFAF